MLYSLVEEEPKTSREDCDVFVWKVLVCELGVYRIVAVVWLVRWRRVLVGIFELGIYLRIEI